MITINNKTKPYLIAAGVIAVILLIKIAYNRYTKAPQDPYASQVKALQHKYDSLASSVKSYKDSIGKIDSSIVGLKQKDAELTGQLKYNEKINQNIKQDYEKTNRFTHYGSADITRYFADSLQ